MTKVFVEMSHLNKHFVLPCNPRNFTVVLFSVLDHVV